MTNKKSVLLCILIMSSQLQNCLNSHWSNPSYWLIIVIAYHQWCSRDLNLRDRDRHRHLVIISRPRPGWNFETRPRLYQKLRDRDFKSCAFWGNFVKKRRHHFWLHFFSNFWHFSDVFGLFFTCKYNKKNRWMTEILIKHFFAIFKVSKPETFETKTRLAKMGLETSLETEAKSRDSIIAYHVYTF